MTLWLLIVAFLGNFGGDIRSLGAGNALSILSSGASALFKNPAGILEQKGPGFTVSYKNPYSTGDINYWGFSISYAREKAGLALGLYTKRLSNVYQENNLMFAFAIKPMSCISISLRPRILNIKAQNSSLSLNHSKLLFDGEILWEHGIVKMGLLKENLTGEPKIKLLTPVRLYSRESISLVLNKPSTVFWGFSWTKEPFNSYLSIGLEAWFTRGFCVRMGVKEKYLTFGLGLKSGKWALNAGTLSHSYLGTTYGISIDFW